MNCNDKRLSITSFYGADHWFLHFHVPDEEKKQNKYAYYSACFMMQNRLRDVLEELRRDIENQSDGLFIPYSEPVKVKHTDNRDGFCLSVQHENYGEKQSLEIIRRVMDPLCAPGFNINEVEEAIFDDPETDALFKENFSSAKELIALWRKDIFEKGSVEYETERVDPFD